MRPLALKSQASTTKAKGGALSAAATDHFVSWTMHSGSDFIPLCGLALHLGFLSLASALGMWKCAQAVCTLGCVLVSGHGTCLENLVLVPPHPEEFELVSLTSWQHA